MLAQGDQSVIGAALVGSAATGREDAWSDIDLALQIAPAGDPEQVAAAWTDVVYSEHDAVDHHDVIAGGVLYRVFLLRSSLQVDVSFWPADQFRATAPGFKVLFGHPNPETEPAAADPRRLIGTAWLYALHARSAIARGRAWQAAIMLDGTREQVIALACSRHGLNPRDGRGVDLLPSRVLDELAGTRAASLDRPELVRSNRALLGMLLGEIRHVDSDLARNLADPFTTLALDHPDDA